MKFRMDSLLRPSPWSLLGLLALLVVCFSLQPADLSASSNGVFDAKQIKKLKKDYAKAIQGQQNDSAIDVIRQISAYGTPDALETVYDLGYQNGSVPAVYDVICEELSMMTGIVEHISTRYDKIDSKGDFRERVYMTDILAYPTNKRGELNDRKVSLEKQLKRIEENGLRPGSDPSIPDRLKQEIEALSKQIDRLKGQQNDEAIKLMVLFLDDKSPFVQGAAVEAFRKSQSAICVEPLINLLDKLLKKRKDVLYHQVRDALWELTGQDFELIEEWFAWWEPRQNTFDPMEETHDGKTGVKRKRRGDDPEFWGVPVESKNIVFVIDTSGSMRYVHKDDIPGLARGDGSDGGQSSGGGQMTADQQRLARFWTRMEMAKRELRKVIRKMSKDAAFNCVRFDTNVSKFKKKATPASNGNKKSAIKWVDGLKYNGNTNTMDALIQAFSQDARTNTIFFLSDGLPSVDGKVNDPTQPILDKVFELNRFRKIKIHCFGFHPFTQGGQQMPGLTEANTWLRKLAETTGGTYTDMKVDPKLTPDNPGD
ncbi:MAG: hypothetical protein CBC13_03180 [Planctomycetia bacterium TMED53]|nr:MAG: hypothetical protein CBC13_03180 [Planctomycetia bacterium TMED53]